MGCFADGVNASPRRVPSIRSVRHGAAQGRGGAARMIPDPPRRVRQSGRGATIVAPVARCFTHVSGFLGWAAGRRAMENDAARPTNENLTSVTLSSEVLGIWIIAP